jgi:hypothetical protein
LQTTTYRKRRAPSDITKTSAAGTPLSTNSEAKRQRTAALRSINQLPQVDLTVDNVVSDNDKEEEIQDEIVVRTD